MPWAFGDRKARLTTRNQVEAEQRGGKCAPLKEFTAVEHGFNLPTAMHQTAGRAARGP